MKAEEPKPKEPEKPPINMPYILTKMIEGMNLSQSMMKDITCEEHNQVAMFFSDQEKKYKCYQCLLKQMNLHLVNDSF